MALRNEMAGALKPRSIMSSSVVLGALAFIMDVEPATTKVRLGVSRFCHVHHVLSICA